ncbi:MAG TPA: HAD hydrolase family protein [Vicinamibacterales bacterium]|nr:HAD hydrolase family protein [Vicinamibacterales bacterium]
MPSDPKTIERKAARVRLVLFDVDGVLTDGQILVHPDGTESKSFSIRDGTAIVWAHRAGLRTGLLSARHSPATTIRAAQLGIPIVRQQRGEKLAVFEDLLREERLAGDEVAFMGDDLLDLPVLDRAGFSAAPADADEEVRERVDWVSRCPGGRGAARELIELVLRAQNRWSELLEGYLRGTRA